MTDRYSAPSDRWSGTAVMDGDSAIAFARGDSIEAPKIASKIAAALNACEPAVIRQMRGQLGIVRAAVERAQAVLTIASETHPDDGKNDLAGFEADNEFEGGIAGECERAGQDALEALHFIGRIMLALPAFGPDGSPIIQSEQDHEAAVAEARAAMEAAPGSWGVLVGYADGAGAIIPQTFDTYEEAQAEATQRANAPRRWACVQRLRPDGKPYRFTETAAESGNQSEGEGN